MNMLTKYKMAKKLKALDIDSSIRRIRDQTEKGLDPQSEEYKQLKEMLDRRRHELNDVQTMVEKLQYLLERAEPCTDKFNNLQIERDREVKRAKEIEDEILTIKTRMEAPKPGSETYERLRQQMDQELKNKKLVKEMKTMGLSADKILMVIVILVIAGFGFALDLDSPKAMKIAQFVLKLPMVKV